MDDAGVVRGLEAGRHLTRDGHHRGHRQAAGLPQHRGEVVAFDERHRDVLDAVDLAHVVDAHDVAMRHLAGQQQLLLEPPFDVARGRRVLGHLGADDLHARPSPRARSPTPGTPRPCRRCRAGVRRCSGRRTAGRRSAGLRRPASPPSAARRQRSRRPADRRGRWLPRLRTSTHVVLSTSGGGRPVLSAGSLGDRARGRARARSGRGAVPGYCPDGGATK